MVTTRLRRSASLALFGWMTLATLAGTSVRAADRPADKILAEIRDVKMPQVASVDRTNRDAVQKFVAQRQAAMERKASLIGELYQQHPGNPELSQLLPERWQALIALPGSAAKAEDEINRVLGASKNEKLVGEAATMKVLIAFRKAGPDTKPADLLPVVDEFIKRFPEDDRGAQMLTAIAGMTKDDAQKAAINQRIEKNYPDSPVLATIVAERRLREAVGKPFPIEFTDAIKGAKINSASLKGKVVIVDFWATWCGPCVTEMPKMKTLYAKYKDQGVEFVGISLDSPREEGGLDKLKAFVKENKIEWPQYYQGNGWESDFSKGWGINSIPAVFAVDASGNLASTEARGKLEELIPDLLAKAGKSGEPVKDKKTASTNP